MDNRTVNRGCLAIAVVSLTAWLAAPSSAAPPKYPAIARACLATMPPGSAARAQDVIREVGAFDLSSGSSEDDEDSSEAELLGDDDIMTAIATYTVDNTGSVYELHSPHTEVPQLGSPKS